MLKILLRRKLGGGEVRDGGWGMGDGVMVDGDGKNLA